ncbi:MAG: lipopolysaccharide biosynthesis protein [Pseudomonadota bacterium]
MTDFAASQSTPDAGGVDGKVARGAAWIAGGYFGLRVIGLANTLIIARILAPDDFGIVAIGVTLMQLLRNFSEIGVVQAVVRFDKAGRRELDTLFSLSVIRGLLIAAILLGAAVYAPAFFDDARIGPVFVVMAMTAFVQSLENPRFHEFQRAIDFRREMFVMTAEKIVMAGVSISIALVYESYWAIILSILIGAIVKVGLTYGMRPYAPRLGFGAFNDIIGFTGWLTGLAIVVAVNNKVSPLILGRLLGPSLTGVYSVGATIAYLPGSDIAEPVARALYPGLSSLKEAPEKMKAALLRGVEALSVIALPASVGCAFVAADLVPILLGDQWGEAVFVVQVYAPTVGLTAVFHLVTEYAVARGEARLACVRELIYAALRFPVFIWATVAYGFEGAVWSLAISGVLHAVMNAWLYARLTHDSPSALLARIARPVAGVAAIAFYFLLVRPQFPMALEAGPFIRLLMDTLAGFAVYAITLFAVWRAAGAPDGVEAAIMRMVGRLTERLRPAGEA